MDVVNVCKGILALVYLLCLLLSGITAIKMVIAKAHLPETYLSGFSPLLIFFLVLILLSIHVFHGFCDEVYGFI